MKDSLKKLLSFSSKEKKYKMLDHFQTLFQSDTQLQ